ncbi:MAG: hypothetical protein IT260_13330 [Saprospiraceae bacterium]|nr:hypothetical protein [Saprospiraceae bacterium]
MAISLRAQGPLDGYLKGKGVLDLAPSFSFNSARNFAGAGGQTYPLAYKGNMLSLFAEYGLGQRIDLVATAAYVFTPQRSGLQDGGLFVKYRPWRRSLSGAGTLNVLVASGLAFPLSNYEPALTGALGQKALIAPARLIVQWETPPGIFLNLTGGYNWRFDRLRGADIARIRQLRPDYEAVPPADFATLLAKIGFPAARFYADAWLEWQWTQAGTDYQPDTPDLPQAYGVSYTQVGGTFFYSESGKNGVYFSGGYILGGRNTSRILRLTAGLVLKLGQ